MRAWRTEQELESARQSALAGDLGEKDEPGVLAWMFGRLQIVVVASLKARGGGLGCGQVGLEWSLESSLWGMGCTQGVAWVLRAWLV